MCESWSVALEVVGFPKLTPTPIHRSAVESWLRFNADVPLRYVAGAAGTGKTTGVHLYARTAPWNVAYVRLHAGATLSTLAESLSRVLGTTVEPTKIVETFPTDARLELVIDEIDNADDDVRALLQVLPHRVPHNVTLIYIARSRRVLELVSLVTQGIAVILDRAALAFTQNEAGELCEALGLEYSPAEVGHLLYASEGWAFAVTGTLRHAAYESRELRGAFGRWHERNARLIRHLVERSLIDLSPAERTAAERIYAGEEPGTTPEYAHLHDCGLLLSYSESELRPLRGITAAALRHVSSAPPIALPVALIEMFGDFRMEIDSRRVDWFRRRDRQLIAFLALQPDAAASRSLVLETFWPQGEPHLAAQSLRTACSTIRRAIAQCVGYDRVGHYFSAGRELRLNNVSITSDRFRTHMRAADEALRDGDAMVARGHYLGACRLYRARLLDGEGNEPWLVGPAEQFADMAAIAGERSVEIRQQRRGKAAVALPPASFSFST
jgi:hypothetical protein